MHRFWQRWTAYGSLFLLYVSPVNAQTWDSILRTIRQRFPTVRQISTQRLAEWLADTNASPRPLLVDAREANEFAVSHLPNAQHLTTAAQIKAIVTNPAQPVVVYCSVGYRSSALAEKVQKAGLTNVWNLEGSLFAWANEGRPVHRGATRLDPARVHPYDKKWGQLLKAEYRAPVD